MCKGDEMTIIRDSLPQNNVTNQGTVLEDFNTKTGWTLHGGTGVIEDDTTNVKIGSNSVKLTNNSTSTEASMIKTINTKINPRLLRYWVYVPEGAIPPTIEISISSSTSLSKRFFYSTNLTKSGWRLITIHRDDWINNGGESWDNTMVRLRFLLYHSASNTVTASFNDCRYNYDTIPKILITFDDGKLSQYNIAYPYLKSKGLKFTWYQITGNLDTVGVTTAMLQNMYDDGNAIANHTRTHTAVNVETLDAAKTDIINGRNDLISKGWTRAADHLAYVGGIYNDDIRNALNDCGVKTARTIDSGIEYVPSALDKMWCYMVYNNSTVATVKGWIDNAIKHGGTCILCFHEIVDSNATLQTQYLTADFKAIVDYIVATNVDVVTIDEFYEGLSNPRYRSNFSR
jgi:peptidoglycan/xylan/chitin deacetylase (PgdA/CDA1 family)